MVNPYNTIYTLYAYDENGKQMNIKNYVTSLGWEENPGELATRITATINDVITHGEAARLTTKIKPGCLLVITAKSDDKQEQVARGYVTTWNPNDSARGKMAKFVAYDELFSMQKSQDQIYYSSGAKTKAVLKKIFSDWGIKMGKYEGPDVKHGKLVYDTEMIGEIIFDILDDAVKKGGDRALLRSGKGGKVSVLKWGSNEDVYVFGPSNVITTDYNISTDDMITKVVVLGYTKDKSKAPIQATVTGKTKYGVRQKFYSRKKDESLSDAQKAAKKILEDEGDPKKTITVKAPDVPFIHKGDKIYMKKVGRLSGEYYVRGIRHDALNRTMTMDLSKKAGEK